MFTAGSKLSLGYAGFAALAAAAYAIASGDRMGSILFVAVLFVMLLLGTMLLGRPPSPVPQPVSPPEARLVEPLGPSAWPVAAAAAAVLFLVGLIVDRPVLAFGLVVLVAAGAGWLVAVWREHLNRTRPSALEAQQRLLAPTGLPLLAILGVGVVVVSLSRILLAVPKEASTAVALGAATAVVLVAFLVSSRPRVSGRALGGMVAVVILALGIGGLVAAGHGERTTEAELTGPVVLRARGIKYSTDQITVTTDESVVLEFRNFDADQIHNVAIYSDSSATRQLYFGDAVNGLGQRTYVFTPGHAGTFFYRCEFHPTQMTGTLTVRLRKDKRR
jgi:plastocyanin